MFLCLHPLDQGEQLRWIIELLAVLQGHENNCDYPEKASGYAEGLDFFQGSVLPTEKESKQSLNYKHHNALPKTYDVRVRRALLCQGSCNSETVNVMRDLHKLSNYVVILNYPNLGFWSNVLYFEFISVISLIDPENFVVLLFLFWCVTQTNISFIIFTLLFYSMSSVQIWMSMYTYSDQIVIIPHLFKWITPMDQCIMNPYFLHIGNDLFV